MKKLPPFCKVKDSQSKSLSGHLAFEIQQLLSTPNKLNQIDFVLFFTSFTQNSSAACFQLIETVYELLKSNQIIHGFHAVHLLPLATLYFNRSDAGKVFESLLSNHLYLIEQIDAVANHTIKLLPLIADPTEFLNHWIALTRLINLSRLLSNTQFVTCLSELYIKSSADGNIDVQRSIVLLFMHLFRQYQTNDSFAFVELMLTMLEFSHQDNVTKKCGGPLVLELVKVGLDDVIEYVKQQCNLQDDPQMSFVELSVEELKKSWKGNARLQILCFFETIRNESAIVDETTVASSNTLNISLETLSEMFPDMTQIVLQQTLHRFGSVDATISHLLEEQLTLEEIDNNQPKLNVPPLPQITHSPQTLPDLLSSRQNLYDNDDFDVLKNNHAAPNILERTLNAEELLNDEFKRENKWLILEQGLLEEDEYDDSFDDYPQRLGEIEQESDSLYDADLVNVYICNYALLLPYARNSKEREAMKERLGMSDEQIEGWRVMFDRSSRKQKMLDQYELEPKKQPVAEGRQTPKESSRQTPKESNSMRGKDTPRGRGRGRKPNYSKTRDKKVAHLKE